MSQKLTVILAGSIALLANQFVQIWIKTSPAFALRAWCGTRPNLPDLIESSGFPITVVFSKAGRMFYSERITGNIWEVIGDKFKLIHHFSIVPITGHHETGLLGVAIDSDFEKNENIYCFYTYGDDEYSMKNKVVRINCQSSEEKVIIDDLPANRIHNGGIIAFSPDNLLYIGVGADNPVMDKAQDINFLGGKVLRMNSDGTIPGDNPFAGSPVYSYGHRNIFGLAFHPVTGELYECEDGPDANDEINIIEKGENYGWPDVTGKVNDSKYVDPIITYTPTITPTQCCFDGKYFYFGSYNEGTVHRLTFEGKKYDKVVKDEVVYRGKTFGVIGVFCTPDHNFYVVTPNKIAAFVPEVNAV
jgi:hypothetical protein